MERDFHMAKRHYDVAGGWAGEIAGTALRWRKWWYEGGKLEDEANGSESEMKPKADSPKEEKEKKFIVAKLTHEKVGTPGEGRTKSKPTRSTAAHETVRLHHMYSNKSWLALIFLCAAMIMCGERSRYIRNRVRALAEWDREFGIARRRRGEPGDDTDAALE